MFRYSDIQMFRYTDTYTYRHKWPWLGSGTSAPSSQVAHLPWLALVNLLTCEIALTIGGLNNKPSCIFNNLRNCADRNGLNNKPSCIFFNLRNCTDRNGSQNFPSDLQIFTHSQWKCSRQHTQQTAYTPRSAGEIFQSTSRTLSIEMCVLF